MGSVAAERTTRRLALALGALVAGLAAYAVVATLATGWTFGQALDGFVVSNAVIGLSFGLCGALIAYHRPGHPVGWLYAVGGALQLLAAAAAPTAQLLQEHGAPTWLVRACVTAFNWSWPVHIGVCLPLALPLLPDGRLPSRRWRPWYLLVAVTAPLFVVEVGTSPQQLAGIPDGWWTLPTSGTWAIVWTASEVRWVLSMLFGVTALFVRYRRGDERCAGSCSGSSRPSPSCSSP